MLNNLTENLLDLFFPPKCAACGRIGTYLCPDCARRIIDIKTQTCPGCNKISKKGKYCSRCRPKTNLSGIIASGYFKDPYLKEAIHVFKYEKIAKLADVLGGYLHETIKNQALGFDVVAFVPISKKRQAWRGFNQAELLAEQISKEFKRPIFRGLMKIKNTDTQVGLVRKARQKNLIGAFKIKGDTKMIQGKRILLLDDVVTTGTTLNECAKILKQNGAREIWAAVLAKE